MKPKRILIAPLDWGLGHATRCIPVIEQLLQHGCEVVIAGSGRSLTLLKIEFPQLTFEELPPYDPEYPATGSMIFAMMRQLPKFRKTIKDEQKIIERVVKARNIDIVISDNRFGCWSRNAVNIFITHQLNIAMPLGWGLLGLFVNRVNHHLIKKFHACWIPDVEGEDNLSGKLSEAGSMNVKFVGMLSRFNGDLNLKFDVKFDILAILSGPEPQRTILEDKLTQQISTTALKALIVRGIPGSSCRTFAEPIEVIDFLTASELEHAIRQSKMIVARSGYSTIMDLAMLGKRALFVPTPGQTEQAYLATQMKVKRIAYFAPQDEFNITEALKHADQYTGFVQKNKDFARLKQVLEELLK
jgi:uncharacterized protein (TIGR00661 family)